jgi:hypothetical protein
MRTNWDVFWAVWRDMEWALGGAVRDVVYTSVDRAVGRAVDVAVYMAVRRAVDDPSDPSHPATRDFLATTPAAA